MRICLIVWQDSSASGPEKSYTLDEIKALEPLRRESVGRLVHEDEVCYVLVGDWGCDPESGEEDYRDVKQILKSGVVCVNDYAEKKDT